MSYDASSIQSLIFRDACRKMPSMYLGDDGQNGIFNSFLEILNNSCDEAMMGRGNEINVEVYPDRMLVKDCGAGVPHGPNADTDEVLIELYTMAHSSGKFNSDNYKKVRGLHGVGASGVCVCSEFFTVITKRDGYVWRLNFTNGVPDSPTAIKGAATDETGTIIEFAPCRSVFHLNDDEPCFDFERIKNELELTSYFIPKVKFVLVNGETKEKFTFLSKNGLRDFAANRIINPLHKHFIYGYKEFDDEVEVEVFAQWTSGKEKSYVFSNGALNYEGGTPIAGAKAAFTRTLNNLAKDDFQSDAIRKGLVYIINVRHPHPIYQNQIKSKIQNPELRGYSQTVFTEAIKKFAAECPEELNKIINVLAREKKAEAAAEKMRSQILETDKELSNEKKCRIILSDKLKDCAVKNHGPQSGSILVITEGDSACGALAKGRPIDSVALLPIRGKILSVLKHDEERIFKNEEIKAIFAALGCGFFEKYDERKLRYQYVGIATDADPDGKNIGCLLTTLFNYMTPDLVRKGRLLWLQTPLFVLEYRGGKKYAFSDAEKNELLNRYGKPLAVGRKKGIGENSVEETKESIFGEQKRWWRLNLPQDESENFNDMIEMLMGKRVDERKQFIIDNVDFSKIGE